MLIHTGVIGILKQRFRILKTGLFFQDERKIVNLVRTCCVLHNRILMHNVTVKLRTGEWQTADALVEEVPRTIYTRSLRNLPQNYVYPARVPRNDFQRRLFALVEHFYVKLRQGEVRWPSRKSTVRYDYTLEDLEVEDIQEELM